MTWRGPAFPRRSCRDRREQRSGAHQLVRERAGQRLPDPEPAARDLLGRRAAPPRRRRDRRLSCSTSPASPTCSTRTGARTCRSRCSTAGWRAGRRRSARFASACQELLSRRALSRRCRAAAGRPDARCGCTCPASSATTPTSTSASITRPTSASSSGPTIRCCPTTNMCRSAITAAQARCGPRASR